MANTWFDLLFAYSVFWGIVFLFAVVVWRSHADRVRLTNRVYNELNEISSDDK